MALKHLDQAFCAGFFSTVPEAEKAIAQLLSAGFSIEKLGVVCPEIFRKDFPKRYQEEAPAASSPALIGKGASIGAVLGGIALAATTAITGGAALIPGAMVLIGGGALAGGFSNLIISDGYHEGISEYFEQAQERNQILVGVYLVGEEEFRKAALILEDSGANSIVPQEEEDLL